MADFPGGVDGRIVNRKNRPDLLSFLGEKPFPEAGTTPTKAIRVDVSTRRQKMTGPGFPTGGG